MTVHRNGPLLTGAQALYWTGQVIAIIVAALVGQMLAPHRLLATLPLACITLGNIAVTRTLSRIMQERGRRAGFTLGSLAGLIGGPSTSPRSRGGAFRSSAWDARCSVSTRRPPSTIGLRPPTAWMPPVEVGPCPWC